MSVSFCPLKERHGGVPVLLVWPHPTVCLQMPSDPRLLLCAGIMVPWGLCHWPISDWRASMVVASDNSLHSTRLPLLIHCALE